MSYSTNIFFYMIINNFSIVINYLFNDFTNGIKRIS